MKRKFKVLLCSIFAIGATLCVGVLTGCSKNDFKNKIDQTFCDHNYGAVATKTVSEATCLVEGEELWTCIDCGKEKTVVLAKLEHDFTAVGGWTKEKQAPTCRVEGIKESRCGVCKTIVTEAVEKLPHVEIQVPMEAATCTTVGHTEYSYCSECNDFITPKVTIPALGHIVETVEGIEATCDSKGLTDGQKCTVCDTWVTAQKDIPALGHKIEYLAPVESTCEETGLTAGYACSRCDVVYAEQTTVPKKAHTDKDNDDFCDICGALNHNVENYTEVKLQVGDKIAGQWLRLYNPNTSTPSGLAFSVENVTYSDGGLLNAGPKWCFMTDQFEIYRRYNVDYFVDDGTFDCSIPFALYEGDNYIDIRFDIGVYSLTFESDVGDSVTFIFEITEDSSILFIKNLTEETTDFPFYKLVP